MYILIILRILREMGGKSNLSSSIVNYITYSMATFAFHNRDHFVPHWGSFLSFRSARRLVVLSFLLHFSSEAVCQSLVYSRNDNVVERYGEGMPREKEERREGKE